MFDTPKKQSIAEKRAEMKEKERVAQERQRQKKEEIEAEQGAKEGASTLLIRVVHRFQQHLGQTACVF